MRFHAGYAYQEFKDKDCSPTPIILLHGAGSTHLGFPASFRHLTGRHVIAPDLPSHGQSARKELSSIEAYAQDICDLLLNLQIHRAVFVGYSMGAAIALQILLNKPSLCARCALLAYSPKSVSPDGILDNDPGDLPQTDWSAQLSRYFYTSTPDQTEKDINHALLQKIDKNTFFNDLELTCRYQPTFPVKKINIPLLYLYGDKDSFIDHSQSELLVEHFKQPDVAVIENAGHIFLWEYPCLILDQLNNFLVGV